MYSEYEYVGLNFERGGANTMSNEEIVLQIHQGVNTVNNMESLYINNKSFIYKIANRYAGYAEIEDLMQEAYFGLYEAVKRYEGDKEIKFLTYAEYWIRQSIRRYIEKYSRNVRMSATLQQKVYQYKQIIKAYERELNRRPTTNELCYYLDISEKQLDRVIMANQEEVSLNATLKDSEDRITMEDTIEAPDNVEETIIEEVYQEQLKRDLWDMVHAVCDEAEAQIITNRYQNNLSIQSTSDNIGISKEEAKQQERKALRKLRCSPSIRVFERKYEEALCLAWKGNGVGTFNQTWTSSTEKAALSIYEKDREVI